jgi:hypothetical protein
MLVWQAVDFQIPVQSFHQIIMNLGFAKCCFEKLRQLLKEISLALEQRIYMEDIISDFKNQRMETIVFSFNNYNSMPPLYQTLLK